MNDNDPIEGNEVPRKKSNKKVVLVDQMNPVSMRLGDQLRADLEEMAELQEVSLGELCRQLIEEGAKNNPERRRRLLARSLAITEAQLERAVEAGVVERNEELASRLKQAREKMQGQGWSFDRALQKLIEDFSG